MTVALSSQTGIATYGYTCITSLVKCCLIFNGSYKYKAPDIAASPEATFCVTNRFWADIKIFPTLQWIIIFGEPGWEAVTTLKVEGQTLLQRLRQTGAEVLNFPHFAQNFQQRAIFGFYPVSADTFEKADTGHKECLCRSEGSSVRSSSRALSSR